MSAILEVSDLRVLYGKVEALHRAALKVEEGAIVTVIGPNGAGKTTMLAAIMGLLPASGEVRYDGASAAGMEVEARVAAGMSLVPEKRELFGEMPVHDNLRLGAFARIRRGERGIDADLRKTGVSILMVEQNARAALQIADYGYVLENGEITVEGPSKELAANPRVVETYLGLKAGAAA